METISDSDRLFNKFVAFLIDYLPIRVRFLKLAVFFNNIPLLEYLFYVLQS